MLLVGGEVYDLTDIKDREKLHIWVDQWVEEHFEELLMNGDLKPEVKQIHELISEEERELLHGKWFNQHLTITHWYEPLTDYLDEMNIQYKVLTNGDVDMFYNGEHIVFTRDENYIKESGNKYEVSKDGIIRRETLEKYGLYFVKDYYLPSVTMG